jgi:hypothetical protein
VAGGSRRSAVIIAAVAVAVSATVMLGGCSALGLGGTTTPKGSVGPTGPTWFYYFAGVPSASGAPVIGGGGLPNALASVSPYRTGASPVYGPEGPCAGRLREGVINGLTVTAARGTGTVTWPNAGDPQMVSYRLAAVPQKLLAGTQAPIAWQTIVPGQGCVMMTATVTGLNSNEYYIFWLDAVTVPPTNYYTEDVMVARSIPVLIP